MWVVEGCSQRVLLPAAVCRNYEREECEIAGLFGTAAVTYAACAAGRLARTSCEKKKQTT